MGLASFNRMRRLRKEREKEKSAEIVEYETLPREELEKVANDDLKERLDQLGIDYDTKAIKKDLIALLIGEELDEKEEVEQGSTEEQGVEVGQNEEKTIETE